MFCLFFLFDFDVYIPHVNCDRWCVAANTNDRKIHKFFLVQTRIYKLT